MIVTTKAIVISTVKYAEADLIIKLFTQTDGLKSYHLRGVLKSKKGKFRASQFQLLTQLEIEANHKNKGTLERLRDIKIIQPYNTLHTDFVKSTVIMFLSEMIRNAIKEEQQNSELFSFLEHTLLWFDANTSANFHVLFLMQLTKYLGFYPDITNTENTYFNLLDGTFQNIETNTYCITGDTKILFTKLLGTNFDNLKTLKLNQNQRLALLNVLLNYYELHLHDFKKPKSLIVLKEMYS